MTPTMRSLSLAGSVVILLIMTGCANISNITNSLTSLDKLEFKVSGLEDMRLAGVDVSKVSDPSKLSIPDALALTNAFSRKSLPASFTVNVDARNPNTGSGGKRSVPLTLNGFDWRLILDDVPTISGDIARPIDIPGTSAATVIPLAVSLDLYQFFASRGYDGVLNLALALGGVNGSTSKVKLDAQPSVGTPFRTDDVSQPYHHRRHGVPRKLMEILVLIAGVLVSTLSEYLAAALLDLRQVVFNSLAEEGSTIGQRFRSAYDEIDEVALSISLIDILGIMMATIALLTLWDGEPATIALEIVGFIVVVTLLKVAAATVGTRYAEHFLKFTSLLLVTIRVVTYPALDRPPRPDAANAEEHG